MKKNILLTHLMSEQERRLVLMTALENLDLDAVLRKMVGGLRIGKAMNHFLLLPLTAMPKKKEIGSL